MSRLQEQSLPSVDTEMRLWAFWVPTTRIQYTGCCGNTPGLGQHGHVASALSDYCHCSGGPASHIGLDGTLPD